MIFSETHKFIFFANSRTGTTSIEKALAPYDEGAEFFTGTGFATRKHLKPYLLRSIFPKEHWEEYFKFVFVRNPYDWLVSQWFHNFRKKPNLIGPFRHKVHVLLYHNYRKHTKVHGRSYKELAQTTKFHRDDILFLNQYFNAEFRSHPFQKEFNQRSFLLDADGNMMVDFIGRFENLHDDFQTILNRIGLDISLPKINSSQHEDYRNYYTSEAAQLAYDLWQEDFRVLGYPESLG